MRIGVVGWGSLIWDPRDLEIEDKWHIDGPMLPVEFARVSSRDRLTLVIVNGVPLQPTLWTLSRKGIVEEAVRNLAKMEGTADSDIGRWSWTDRYVASESNIFTITGLWA